MFTSISEEHGVTSQKAVIFMVTTMRTWNQVGWCSSYTLASYSGGTRFESQLGYWQSWLRFFMVSLSPPKPWLGCGRFLPNLFQLSFTRHPAICPMQYRYWQLHKRNCKDRKKTWNFMKYVHLTVLISFSSVYLVGDTILQCHKSLVQDQSQPEQIFQLVSPHLWQIQLLEVLNWQLKPEHWLASHILRFSSVLPGECWNNHVHILSSTVHVCIHNYSLISFDAK
jgi:hypothetical protein